VFLVAAAELWNELPGDVTASVSLTRRKGRGMLTGTYRCNTDIWKYVMILFILKDIGNIIAEHMVWSLKGI